MNRRKGLLALPMLLWAALFVGVGLIYIIALSVMKKGDAFNAIPEFTLENYARVFSEQYGKAMLNSLRLAFLTTGISLLLGYPFAYFMARTEGRARLWLLLLIIAPFWTNALIRMYGWKILLGASGSMNQVLKALGIIQKPIKILYTETAVLIGMVYAMIPFIILPVYSGLERMDWTVVEAARDLGASPFKAFWTMTFRMTLPSTLAGCVLTLLPSIGLFFISDILGGSNTFLWGNLVHDELLKSRDTPMAAALSVVLLMLTFLILVVYRRAGGSNEEMVF